MEQYKIDFESMAWESPADGVKKTRDSHEWRFLKGFLGKHSPHRQDRLFKFQGFALVEIDAKNSTYKQFRQFWQKGLNKCKITGIIA